MLTILCWLWKQETSRATYTADHVNIWADMVRRNLAMPHRIACVTDMPNGIEPGIEIITPPGDFLDVSNPRWANGKPQCYRRLSMFRRDAAEIFGERFVCMDIDCVVTGHLDTLFDRPEDLVLFKGTSRTRPYNGSMMLIRAGCRPHVFDDFDQAAAIESGALYCGSDQAWLAHRLGWNERTWSEQDGVHWFGTAYMARRRPHPRVIFFPGKMKPWTVAKLDPLVGEHYRIKEAA